MWLLGFCYYDSDEEGEEESVIRPFIPSLTIVATYPRQCEVSGSESGGSILCDLEDTFDPELAYCLNFSRFDDVTESQSQSGCESPRITPEHFSQWIQDSEAIFEEARRGVSLTAREVIQGLRGYERAIRFTTDTEKKKSWIQRYEVHKFDHDSDNVNDREQATMYLENARLEQHLVKNRIEYYQRAVKYTNNIKEKEAIRQEYYTYCTFLKSQRKNISQ